MDTFGKWTPLESGHLWKVTRNDRIFESRAGLCRPLDFTALPNLKPFFFFFLAVPSPPLPFPVFPNNYLFTFFFPSPPGAAPRGQGGPLSKSAKRFFLGTPKSGFGGRLPGVKYGFLILVGAVRSRRFHPLRRFPVYSTLGKSRPTRGENPRGRAPDSKKVPRRPQRRLSD